MSTSQKARTFESTVGILFLSLACEGPAALYLIQYLFPQAKAKLNQNASEKRVGKKQEANSPVKSNNQEITIFSGSHPPPPNKHQEIWSVLESVWITIYENRYYISENFWILEFFIITVIHWTVCLGCEFNVQDYLFWGSFVRLVP